MDCFRGKRFNIYSDCSYSGNWIKDYVKILDDLGIPSCGHYTREQKMLINVFCSCKADEEATALCYAEAGVVDSNRDVIMIKNNMKLSSGQTTKHCIFVLLRCSKKSEEKCEIDASCTWKDRIFYEPQVHIRSDKDTGEQLWYYVLVDEDKVEAFKEKEKSGKLDLAECGKILEHGWGDPPKDILRKLDLKYKSIIDPIDPKD